MNKKQRMKLKRTAMVKWGWIVDMLQGKELSSEEVRVCLPCLTEETCGHCEIYGDAGGGGDCEDCPLNTTALCYGGDGRAYTSVIDFRDGDEGATRRKALKGAKAIHVAILKDIEKEEAT